VGILFYCHRVHCGVFEIDFGSTDLLLVQILNTVVGVNVPKK
jgi:hypothetical protein